MSEDIIEKIESLLAELYYAQGLLEDGLFDEANDQLESQSGELEAIRKLIQDKLN